MIIHVYTHVFNEAPIFPYFLRHYEQVADKIVVYDAGSTDGTLEMAANHPKVDLRDFYCHEVDEQAYIDLAAKMYKESRGQADWVIVVDADEFVYHPNLLERLAEIKSSGYNLITTDGYQMIHDKFPTTPGQIYEEVKWGEPSKDYSKQAIFDPSLDVNFAYGKHWVYTNPYQAVPIGKESGIKLLHCNYMGIDHVLNKYGQRLNRISEFNKKTLGAGYQMLWSRDDLKSVFDHVWSVAVQVVKENK